MSNPFDNLKTSMKQRLTTQFFKLLGELAKKDKKEQAQGMVKLFSIIDKIWQDGKDTGIAESQLNKKD